MNSDVETINASGSDVTASRISTGKLYLAEAGLANISAISLQDAPTEVVFTSGGNALTLAGSNAITTFTGGAGADTVNLNVTSGSYTVFRASSIATFSVNWTDTSDGQLLDLRNLTMGAIIIFVNDDVTDDAPDTIYGGDGDDVFINGEYIDEWGTDLWGPVYGQGGTDEIRFGGNWDDGVDGAINGVEFLTLSSAASVTLDAQTEAFTITGSSGNDTIVAGAGADTITGGDGADMITGGSGLDSIAGGAGADVIRIGAVVPTSTDTVVGFVSGTDKVQVLSSLLFNGTNSAILHTTTIFAWTNFGGSLSANDIFIEFTDDTGAPGSCDEASEVAALLTAGATQGVQTTALFDFLRDEIVLFLHDGTDGYLWHWSEAAGGGGNVDASELTLLVKLVGVTNIAIGDLAVYV